jgi:hypothetical protein
MGVMHSHLSITLSSEALSQSHGNWIWKSGRHSIDLLPSFYRAAKLADIKGLHISSSFAFFWFYDFPAEY